MEAPRKQPRPVAATAPAQPPRERTGRQRTRSVSFARDRSESVSLRDRSRSRGRGRQPSVSPDRRRASVEYGFDDYDYDSAADSPSRSRSRGRTWRDVLHHSPPRRNPPYPISRSPSLSRSRSRPGKGRRSSSIQRGGGSHAARRRSRSRAPLRDKVKPLDAVKGAAPLLATIGVASVLAHKFWPKGVLYGDKEEWQRPTRHGKLRQSHLVEKDREGRVRRERHLREDEETRVVDDYDYRRGAGGQRSYPERRRAPERPFSMYDDHRRTEPRPVHPTLEYVRGDGRSVYDERGLRGGMREYDERPVDRYSTRNWA